MQPAESMSAKAPLLLQRHRLPLRMAAALIALLSLSGCSGGVLDPQGPIGGANAKILLNALGIMLVIVVPTILAILLFAWCQ
jgi:cytochrome o ubiquinol oxidase subunit 2